MSPDDIDFDEMDRMVYLALQAKGEIIPCDLETYLDESFDNIKLPVSLLDTEGAVRTILLDEDIPFPCEPEDPQIDISEWKLAARNGTGISDISLEKIRKLRENREK